jgi:hypothetical protein
MEMPTSHEQARNCGYIQLNEVKGGDLDTMRFQKIVRLRFLNSIAVDHPEF